MAHIDEIEAATSEGAEHLTNAAESVFHMTRQASRDDMNIYLRYVRAARPGWGVWRGHWEEDAVETVVWHERYSIP